MQRSHLLIFVLLVAALPLLAQPSMTITIGTVFSTDGEDPYGFSTTPSWPPTGANSEETYITFFDRASGFTVKGSLAWEVSDYFVAGMAFQLVSMAHEENFRKGDIVSFGPQFRVNFNTSRKKVVPFIQGTYYFVNSNYYQQDAASKSGRTQPAFSLSATSSIGFSFDLGLEVKLNNTLGLQFTAGYNGVQPIEGMPISLDYGAGIAPPKGFEGGFYLAVTTGLKYYFGRGSKQRDF